MRRLQGADRAIVPAHWPLEVSNGLLMGVRRKRIPHWKPEVLWDELSSLPIALETALNASEAKAVLRVSDKHGLTVNDAAYLELAIRKQLPLATLDADLRRAESPRV